MPNLRLLIFLSIFATMSTAYSSMWAWECKGEGDAAGCVKVRSTETSKASLSRCRLTCGPYGSLFPRPKQATIGDDVSYFQSDNIILMLHDCHQPVCRLLDNAFNIMVDRLSVSTSSSKFRTDLYNDNIISLNVIVSGRDEHLTLTTDESYTLDISPSMDLQRNITVNITAPNFFGARHGLETLSQLITYDEGVDMYEIVNNASIIDSPAYPYRGVMVDTSRNFLPISLLLKTMDALSYHKLNTFHWHITDSAAFPMELQNLPNMTIYGAYAPDEVYSKEDILLLVEYARERGIRVLPELDAPAHVGYGWDWGPETGLGNLVVCLGEQPWPSYCSGPPCGQFNLANTNSYNVLSQIYKDMMELFSPIDMFHYGGDEVNLNCWNSTKEIVDWMIGNNYPLDEDSYYNQWNVFQEQARQLLTEANDGTEVPGIVWTSTLTEQDRADRYLEKNKYIIQIWTDKDDPLIAKLLQEGYNVIFSNSDALYFSSGFSSFVGAGTSGHYEGWQGVYDNNLREIVEDMTGSTQYFSQVLGGEGAVWAERMDEHNFELRLWPRAAALAERLWTDPDTDYSHAEARMLSNRERIVRRGVEAERLQPEWCGQNNGECRNPALPKP